MSSRIANPAGITVLLLLSIASGCGGGGDAPLPPQLPQTETVDPEVRQAFDVTYAKVEAEPDRVDLRLELAGVYAANNRTDLAQKTYEQIVELDPERPKAWYHLGRMRATAGDPDGALAAYDEVVARAPSPYHPVYWRRGLLFFQKRDLDRAREAFARAAELAPSDPSGQVGLAEIAMDGDDYAGAIGILEPLIQAHPGDSQIVSLLARAYRHEGRENDAVGIEKTSGPASRVYRMDQWVGELQQYVVLTGTQVLAQASYFLQNGRPNEALQLVIPALEKNPTDLGLIGRATDAFTQLGQLDQALDLLDAVSQRLPPNYRIELNRGMVLHRKGMLPLALESLTLATELAPAAPEGFFHLARVLGDLDRLEDSITAVDKAIELGLTEALAYMLRGRCLFRLGVREQATDKLELALAQFEGVIGVDPQHPTAKAFRAASLVELLRFDEARVALDEIEGLDPRMRPPVVNQVTQAARARIAELELAGGESDG